MLARVEEGIDRGDQGGRLEHVVVREPGQDGEVRPRDLIEERHVAGSMSGPGGGRGVRF